MVAFFVDGFRLIWSAIAPSLPALVTSFLSVLIGALPFIVIAAFASAVLEVFVSKDAIARLVPKNTLGILLAPLFGLFIPMCECGIVPVARRMIQKGVPNATAVTFMLSNPILNPLSIYATYLAFPFARQMVWWRVGLGYVVSVLIGLIIQARYRTQPNNTILHHAWKAPTEIDHEHTHDCDCGHEHDHHDHADGSFGSKVLACLHHASIEFFDVLKYFIMGSAIAAISQAVLDRQVLELIGGGRFTSVIVMIAFAYVICICSEADAFVAATFASTFMPGALLAFLVAGAMTDIKNTMMMKAAFDRSFVLLLNVLIISITATVTVGLNLVVGWGVR